MARRAAQVPICEVDSRKIDQRSFLGLVMGTVVTVVNVVISESQCANSIRP